MQTLKTLSKLAVAVALAELAGVAGSLFTAPAIGTWYTTLVRPELSPPDWVFAPVWTTLYLLMGIAAFLVWRRGVRTSGVRLALLVFLLQLALNTAWSIIFFGWQDITLALVDIMVLWLTIVWTTALFHRLSTWAAYLLVPYLAWVSFAAYLNYQFLVLNVL